jgi:hypothetical protein
MLLSCGHCTQQFGWLPRHSGIAKPALNEVLLSVGCEVAVASHGGTVGLFTIVEEDPAAAQAKGRQHTRISMSALLLFNASAMQAQHPPNQCNHAAPNRKPVHTQLQVRQACVGTYSCT